MVVARVRDGKVECFEVIENEHRDHILKTSRVPQKLPRRSGHEARQIATRIAKAFDYVGVLAVEMFMVRKGRRHVVLVNEIEPACTIPAIGRSTAQRYRSWNSTSARSRAGRWGTSRLGRRVEMTNLIGSEMNEAARWLTVPGASVHIYGKGERVRGAKWGSDTGLAALRCWRSQPRPHIRKRPMRRAHWLLRMNS